jgi:RNA polymerase sigma-70 factor (ECF subfamily)
MADSKGQSRRDDYVARTIRIKAKTLAGQLNASDDDRREFEQRLWECALRARSRHDPERGQWSTFLDRILANEVLNMIEHWYTQKRSNERRAQGWNDVINQDDDDSLTFDETYSQEDYFGQVGFGPRPESETRDMRIDIAWALRRLPPDLRRIAEWLMHGSIADAARQLKIPRATLYGKIARIEKVFRKAGLDPKQPGRNSQKVGRRPDSSAGSSCK